MNNFVPLWSGLVDSSFWQEPDHVFRVFIGMMTLKDRDHIVTMDAFKLSRRIHMPLDVVTDALKILSSPDKRRPGQEFDGRRIKEVEGGWLILQGEFYKQMIQKEMSRTRNARAQKAFRERQKKSKASGTPLPGEQAYVDAVERGDAGAAAKVLEGLERPAPETLPGSLLRAHGPNYCSAMIEAGLQCEVCGFVHELADPKGPFCPYCRTFHRDGDSCPGAGGASPGKPEPSEFEQIASSVPEPDRTPIPGPCTYCGGDHWRPDCPVLAEELKKAREEGDD